MRRLVWRANALDDLEAIVAYIPDRDLAAAERLQDAVEACAARLRDYPFLYRRGRVPGTREAVVHPNYIIVYRVAGETVEVVSLVHARQHYPG